MNEIRNTLFIIIVLGIIIIYLYFRIKGKKIYGKECPYCGTIMERVHSIEYVEENAKNKAEEWEMLRQYRCPKCGLSRLLDPKDVLREFMRLEK